MNLKFAPYIEQNSKWPQEGRHILAQYDNNSIVIYQAFRASIATFALKHGYFGGEFSLSRMSWIKPNFLWMMYRSGWGTKPGQEHVLAIKIKRKFFDLALQLGVSSSYEVNNYNNEDEWRNALKMSSVRIQWDPDHAPNGEKLKRRAIQLGLRNEILKKYSKEAILEIFDLGEILNIQREYIQSGDYSKLKIPLEKIYIPYNKDLIQKLGLSRSDSYYS